MLGAGQAINSGESPRGDAAEAMARSIQGLVADMVGDARKAAAAELKELAEPRAAAMTL